MEYSPYWQRAIARRKEERMGSLLSDIPSPAFGLVGLKVVQKRADYEPKSIKIM